MGPMKQLQNLDRILHGLQTVSSSSYYTDSVSQPNISLLMKRPSAMTYTRDSKMAR